MLKQMRVRLTFTEKVLGSQSGDPEITRTYIASKSEDAMKIEEEVAALGVDGVEEKTMTIFPKMEDGTPHLWDYQIRGFFKSACGALNLAEPKTKLPAYKSKIDKLVFVDERVIPLVMPEGGKIEQLQRPLRAQTAQGERIALANSETVPAGTTIEFGITVLEPEKVKPGDKSLIYRVADWLDYGRFSGIGQWRNASFGRFVWDMLDEDGEIIGGNNEV